MHRYDMLITDLFKKMNIDTIEVQNYIYDTYWLL